MRITPLRIESQEYAKKIMNSLGVSKEGLDILVPKSVMLAFKVEGLSSWEANILKQHLLSLGSDSAIPRDALIKKIKVDTCIFGTLSQLTKLCQKLCLQPFRLRELSGKISTYIDNLCKKEFIFCARGKILKINKPVICGIINVTGDSFSGDGLLNRLQIADCRLLDLVLRKAEVMLKHGAQILDVGGESTRPFSKPIKETEEISRVIPVLRALRKEFKKILLSVDTYKYNVAKASIEEGADIINDITALRKSPKIASLVKRHKLGCVIMHMKGMPQTMQARPYYKDVVGEVIDFFNERLAFCLSSGIDARQILIDPGIGFGKRLQDNLRLIAELYKFKIFGLPIFLGISRKSFIGKLLDAEPPRRLTGTIAATVVAFHNGANIVRVHDVQETNEAIKIVSGIHKFYN